MGKVKVKTKAGKLLCIILKENKSSAFKYVGLDKDRFSIDSNTYFVSSEGAYIKGGSLIAVYLEGVSLPVHHGYIQKETVTKMIENIDGKQEKHKITKIKGLKFDSDLIDMLLNRHLADEFTKVHLDMPNLILAILLFAGLVVNISVLGVLVWFINNIGGMV